MAMGWPVRTARAVAGKRSMSSTWPTTLVSNPSRSALTRTELVVLQREDVAVGGADRLPEALGQRREDGLEVVCLRRDRASSRCRGARSSRCSSFSTRRAVSNAPASVCAVLRRKLRYSEKSGSRVS